MLLTPLAHRMHRMFSPFAVVVALAASLAAKEPAVPVLDLTKTPPREQQVTSVPGMSVGGIEGQSLPKGYILPLKIELLSIAPLPAKLGDKFIVEVRLQNIGSSAFFLPASQNSVEVLQHEGKGRRDFDFNLIFADPSRGRQVSSIVGVAAGSDSVKGSLLRIEPGKSVRVLLKADLEPIAGWLNSGADHVQVRAGASEWTFEDVRYFIKSQSEPIISDQTQEIEPTR
ncbi:MAG: hypothetical protein ACRD2U_08745 [Terriglobales bacterium]